MMGIAPFLALHHNYSALVYSGEALLSTSGFER